MPTMPEYMKIVSGVNGIRFLSIGVLLPEESKSVKYIRILVYFRVTL